MTIAPCAPRSSGIACLDIRNVPRTLVAKTSSQRSTGVSGTVSVLTMPAPLTSTSSVVEAREQRGDRVGVGDVERGRARLAAGGADQLGGLVERRLRAPDGEHGGALGGEALGDRAADARAGAGDQRAGGPPASCERGRGRHRFGGHDRAAVAQHGGGEARALGGRGGRRERPRAARAGSRRRRRRRRRWCR